MRKKIVFIVVLLLVVGIAAIIYLSGADDREGEERQTIKVGYFPNITHAPALVGMATGRIQDALGDDIAVEVKIFNAGPSEIEALFAGEIDIGYIGPSPSINGYIKSKGQALRIVSGVSSGGASLVVQPEVLSSFKEEGIVAFEGKKISSPQQGNTQDISLRHYLKENGLTGRTAITPIANADQLTMFALKELDGAWSPEPWASRIVVEAGGERLIDERDLWPDGEFCTTNIIVGTGFLEEHPDLVRKWIEAHIQVVEWINVNPESAKEVVNSEIERLTTKKLPEEVLSEAWQMLSFSVNPIKDSVFTFADWGYEEGFLGEGKPDLSELYDLRILNEITNQQY